jgi:hypothetical protein
VDEIPIVEEVLSGMFFLNECRIIILFDSGALHDFMSSTCAKKAKLTLVALGMPHVISTPHDIEWSRNRYHPRDDLDEIAHGHT